MVRDSKGRIFGPIRTERITELIKKGILVGSEKVCKFPSSEWQEISRVPEFYDALLDVLRIPAYQKNETEKLIELTKAQSDGQTDDKQKTSEKQEPETYSGIAEPESEPPAAAEKNRPRKKKIDTSTLSSDDIEVIDLSPRRQLVRQKSQRQKALGLGLTITGLVLAGIFLIQEPKTPKRIQLMLPRAGQPTISDTEALGYFNTARAYFYRDSFSSYLQAQTELVRTIEGRPQTKEAMELLCLTYRELWPFSDKGVDSLAVVSQLAQRASQADSMGSSGDICRLVQLELSGNFLNFATKLDSSIRRFVSSPYFYEMKARELEEKDEHVLAISYIQKTQQILPEWNKSFVFEAIVRDKLGQLNEARKLFQKVIASYGGHAEAKVLQGILEIDKLQQYDSGFEKIKEGLEVDRVMPQLESKAWTRIATYYSKNGNNEKAVESAKKAFFIDSTNLDAKDLFEKLSGTEISAAHFMDCQEVMTLGEQFLRSGNDLAAQAEFRAAFDTCSPANPLAAIKAAESLWRLNQSREALEWVDKAIRVDPNSELAWIKKADFLAQRFDFELALQALLKARQIKPKSFEVIRASSEFEFRRKNFKEAIELAKQALRLYDTDTDTHLILVKSFLALGDVREAYQWASRAIELDSSSPNAHAIYAETLAAFQGVESATNYLKEKMNIYPAKPEYKKALGKILYEDDQFEAAVQILMKGHEQASSDKSLMLLLAKAQYSNKDHNAALKTLLGVAAIDPTDAEPLSEIGLIYLNVSDASRALNYFNKAINVNDRFPQVHLFKGRALNKLGRTEEALSAIAIEQKRNPMLAAPYLEAAEIYMNSKVYSRAIQNLQSALKLRNDTPLVYLRLAEAYRLSGNIDVALSMVNVAAQKESGNPLVHREMGLIYKLKGDHRRARQAFETYLDLAPNAPDRAAIQSEL